MFAKTSVVSLSVAAFTMAAVPSYADTHESELLLQSASVTETVADSIGLDLGTLADALSAEIAQAIAAGVISSETVEIVLTAVEAGEQDPVSSVLEAQATTNSDQWTAESEAWLAAESEVVQSGAADCAVEDTTCQAAVASTISTMVSERLLRQIQGRIDEVLSLPEAERADELEDMSEAVRDLRERLSLLARQPESEGDESELGARQLDALNNFRSIDEDIAEDLAEILTGDDDILDDWFDDDDDVERDDDDDVERDDDDDTADSRNERVVGDSGGQADDRDESGAQGDQPGGELEVETDEDDTDDDDEADEDSSESDSDDEDD